MVDRAEGAATPKGADSKLPGWHPKENATQLPQEGEL